MRKLALFDFDGTLMRGDSTKLAFKLLYKNLVTFYFVYYLKFSIGYFVYLFTNNFSYLREMRRMYLLKRYEILKSSIYPDIARNKLFKIVFNEFEGYIQKGYDVVIVSAGYSELIRLVIGEDLEYELVANSLFTTNPDVVNYDNKVTRLNQEFKSNYFVEVAYGNTKGDIPMLQLAKKAFWVDENGEISEFRN